MVVSKRKRIFGGIGIVVLVLVIGYTVIRPFHLRWGATDAETSMVMPGDLAGPRWTRAITVNASAEVVWPWLVQWGQGRGGWYSYDWLENLMGFNIHTADRILPEFQNPAIGDPICMAQNTCTSFVSVIEPHKWFGWHSKDPDGKPVWTFMLGLVPIDESNTRLLVRESFDTSVIPAPVVGIIEIPDVVMELKSLDTVKQLAEGVPASPLVTVVEIVLWLAAFAVGMTAAVWFVRSEDWKLPLAIGILSIIVLLVITFLYPPLWLRAVLDTALLAGLIWYRSKRYMAVSGDADLPE